ncbi:Non-hemolytic phospholipase C precursor [compost metagenome]
MLTGNIDLKIVNLEKGKSYTVLIIDNAYGTKPIKKLIGKASTKEGIIDIVLDLTKNHSWYDFSVKVEGFDTFEKRYAGRVETGKDGYSDPLMGGLIS